MARADLSELTVFITIAEQMSFRAAARVLGVSPSALSHTIRHLEERLGTRLFNRTTRSVALTDAGERLLLRVRPAIVDLNEAVAEVALAHNRPSGSIRISASENGAMPIIAHVLPDFLATYPDIHVEIVVDTRLVDIVADGFDAGIRIQEDVPQDMIAIPFGAEMRFAVVASPAYLARCGTPKTPQDLLKHRCIRYRFASGTMFRWTLEKGGRSKTIDVKGPMTLGNPPLMVEAAARGIAMAWLPLSYVVDHLASGQLVHVLPEWGLTFPNACLYYPANRHPPSALRLFTGAVRDWAERSRAP